MNSVIAAKEAARSERVRARHKEVYRRRSYWSLLGVCTILAVAAVYMIEPVFDYKPLDLIIAYISASPALLFFKAAVEAEPIPDLWNDTDCDD